MEANSKLSLEDKEASEKLVENNKPKAEVMEPQSQTNGETMIIMSEVRQAFVGMGKEELMKFANDPFWVKLRWFLFALFWFMWLGMLFGAIAIIFFAPKCVPPLQQPLPDQIIYQVDLVSYQSNQDSTPIQEFAKRVDYLKELGVTSVLLNNLMNSSHEGYDHIIDFKAVHPNFGTIDQLKNLLKTLKDNGIKTFLKVVPNYSSISHNWFNQSASQVDQFKDYYIWSPGQISGSSKSPPNNWLSVNGGNAWKWNEKRQEFYLHQFNESLPDLNFRNADVIKHFSDVFKHWLTVGFDGIHIDKLEYLIEDEKFEDEILDHLVHGAIHDDYRFWTHFKTTNQAENTDCLRIWSQGIRNNSGLVTASGVNIDSAEGIVDLAYLPYREEQIVKVAHLHNYINHNLARKNKTWLWEVTNTTEDITLFMDAAVILLPGSAMFSSGRELNEENFYAVPIKLTTSNESRQYQTYMKYKQLIDIKKSLSHTNDTEVSILDSHSIVLARLDKDNSRAYIFLFNPDWDNGIKTSVPIPKELSNITNTKPILYSNSFKMHNQEIFLGNNYTLSSVVLPKLSYALFELEYNFNMSAPNNDSQEIIYSIMEELIYNGEFVRPAEANPRPREPRG